MNSDELLDVETINPVKGDKFSPNLYKFLKRHGLRTSHAYEHNGHMWLGFKDPDFNGVQLGEVLCKGAKVKLGWFHLTDEALWIPIPDFWERYIAIGRCLLDTSHVQHFKNDELRWAEEGDTRTCQWCGCIQHLKRWEETISRQAWMDAP